MENCQIERNFEVRAQQAQRPPFELDDRFWMLCKVKSNQNSFAFRRMMQFHSDWNHLKFFENRNIIIERMGVAPSETIANRLYQQRVFVKGNELVNLQHKFSIHPKLQPNDMPFDSKLSRETDYRFQITSTSSSGIIKIELFSIFVPPISAIRHFSWARNAPDFWWSSSSSTESERWDYPCNVYTLRMKWGLYCSMFILIQDGKCMVQAQLRIITSWIFNRIFMLSVCFSTELVRFGRNYIFYEESIRLLQSFSPK